MVCRARALYGALDRWNLHVKVCLAARFLDSLEPIWDMNIVYEIRKALASHRHNLGELFVDQIELPAIEPKTATVPAIVQVDVVRLQKPYLIQNEIVASGTLLYLLLRFLILLLLAIFDTSLNLKSHLVQLAGVEPKAAALFACVVGNAIIFTWEMQFN